MLDTAVSGVSPADEGADTVFGLGKKKPSKGNRDSKLDRYIEQKHNEAAWSFLGSAKEESDRQVERGGS